LLFGIFTTFDVVDYFLRKDKSFNSTTTGAEAIIIISLCLYYFYEQLRDASNLLIYTTHDFWIIIAFLIYISGTFFLYIFAENTLQDKDFQVQYIYINSGFNLLRNILLSIAMLMKPTQKSKPDFPNESSFPTGDISSFLKNVN
jgi:hypothetical protein